MKASNTDSGWSASSPSRVYPRAPRAKRALGGLLLAGLVSINVAGDATVSTISGGPSSANPSSSSGFANGNTANDAQFNHPFGLAIDQEGNLLIADRDNHAVRKIDFSSGFTFTFALVNLLQPIDLVVDSGGNVLVLNQGNGTVVRFDLFGQFEETVITGLINPTALAIDSDDNLYVSETGGSVTRFAQDGSDPDVMANGLQSPGGLEVMDDGTIAISETGNNAVLILNPFTSEISVLSGGNGAGFTEGDPSKAQFNQPLHLAKTPNGGLVVADRGNHRYRVVQSDGFTTTLYGISPIDWVSDLPGWEDGSSVFAEARDPAGVFVSLTGTVYTTETFYHLIREATGANLGTAVQIGPDGETILVTPPTISPEYGYYPMGIDIQVNSPNRNVFYTTDGTEPTTNSLPVEIRNNVGAIPWREALKDLRQLRVKAFSGTNASVTVFGQPAPLNEIGIAQNIEAGIGSTAVVPLVMNLRPDEEVRSLQYRVEVRPVGSAPMVSSQFKALSISTNDFVPLAGSNVDDEPAMLTAASYTVDSSRGLVISALGTNANFQVENFAAVALLAVPIPPESREGDAYEIEVLFPSGTSDGLQSAVDILPMAPRTISIRNVPYLVGDSSPGGWYNAGAFGDGNLNNNDVNNAFLAALGVHAPFPFTDAFDAMDAFPVDAPGTVGGDGEVRFLDWQQILQRSLRLDPNNWERSWSESGFRVSSPTGLSASSLSASSFLEVPEGQVWLRQAMITSATIEGAAPGETVDVPVHVKVGAGFELAGMIFRAIISSSGSHAVESVSFMPADGIPQPVLGTGLSAADLLCGWPLAPSPAFVPSLEGNVLLGHLQFRIPQRAARGDCYRVEIAKPDGSPNDSVQYDFETKSGCVWVLANSPSPVDEISDDWKVAFFGDVNHPDATASADPDNDGFPNVLEFRSGTDPGDPLSKLELLAPRWDSENKQIGLQWLTAPGKAYLLEGSRSLGDPQWVTIASGVVGDGSLREVWHEENSDGMQFYRVRIQP